MYLQIDVLACIAGFSFTNGQNLILPMFWQHWRENHFHMQMIITSSSSTCIIINLFFFFAWSFVRLVYPFYSLLCILQLSFVHDEGSRYSEKQVIQNWTIYTLISIGLNAYSLFIFVVLSVHIFSCIVEMYLAS